MLISADERGAMTMAHVRAAVDTWDELVARRRHAPPGGGRVLAQLPTLGLGELQERQTLAELDILTMGITFTVYSDGRGIDRAWPFDVIPRVIARASGDASSGA